MWILIWRYLSTNNVQLFVEWFVDWFVDWLVDWFVDWIVEWFVDWFVDELLHVFVELPTDSFWAYFHWWLIQ